MVGPNSYFDVPAAVLQTAWLLRPVARIVHNACVGFPKVSAYYADEAIYLPNDDGCAAERIAPHFDVSVGAVPPPYAVLVKAADLMAPVGDAWLDVNEAVGGPSPLTTAILGGLLGGGVGLGTGTVLDALAPRSHFDKRRMKRSLGLAGAGLGAMPGLALGAMESGQDPKHPGQTFKESLGGGWTVPFRDLHEKQAAFGFADPSIQVDDFNRAVWSDAGRGTPGPVAAAVTGITSGAGVLTRSQNVSPFDVGMAAAIGGAKGASAGWLFGKTLGVLAGLRPESQQKLQDAGLWGGVLAAVTKKVFPGLVG